MTEFVVNECYSTLTEMFFFMITTEFNLRMNFDIMNLSTHITRKRILKRKIANILKEMKKIKKTFHKNK